MEEVKTCTCPVCGGTGDIYIPVVRELGGPIDSDMVPNEEHICKGIVRMPSGALKWEQGYYLNLDNKSYILPVGKTINDIVQVIERTICRFSGFYARGVQPIFERDILTPIEGSCEKYVVGFDDNLGNWYLSGGVKFPLNCMVAEQLFMYGNISEDGLPGPVY